MGEGNARWHFVGRQKHFPKHQVPVKTIEAVGCVPKSHQAALHSVQLVVGRPETLKFEGPKVASSQMAPPGTCPSGSRDAEEDLPRGWASDEADVASAASASTVRSGHLGPACPGTPHPAAADRSAPRPGRGGRVRSWDAGAGDQRAENDRAGTVCTGSAGRRADEAPTGPAIRRGRGRSDLSFSPGCHAECNPWDPSRRASRRPGRTRLGLQRHERIWLCCPRLEQGQPRSLRRGKIAGRIGNGGRIRRRRHGR